MSTQTSKWLNTMTVIGNTATKGQAWHYRLADQEGEGNHYEGPVPIERVRELVGGVRLVEGTVESTVLTEEGVTRVTDPTRKTIYRLPKSLGATDPGGILGVFKAGYQIHQYEEWLLENVETILGEGLSIGSAGLLDEGAVAWVQVEMPENRTVEGVEFREFITAATSCNGSLATGYSANAQLVVCDNTLHAARREGGRMLKIRHTSGSLSRIRDVQDALGILADTGEGFADTIRREVATKVTPKQWQSFLDALVPIPAEKGRSQTTAWSKQEALKGLWMHDERVSPWAGTAFGVVQAVNTWAHHVQGVRGATKWERNATRMVKGEVQALDTNTRTVLAKVLSNA